MVSIASSNSFSPAIPVERMMGIFVSAIAVSNGKLVTSLLATFSLSGVNNFSKDKQPFAQSVSTKSNPIDLAYLYTSKCSSSVNSKKALCSPYVLPKELGLL